MHRLQQMQNGNHSEVWLFSTATYGGAPTWNAHFKGTVNDLHIEIKVEGSSPQEALTTLFDKWLSITGRVPELLGALPPPPPTPDEDSQDGDQFVNVPPANALDDDIPF